MNNSFAFPARSVVADSGVFWCVLTWLQGSKTFVERTVSYKHQAAFTVNN